MRRSWLRNRGLCPTRCEERTVSRSGSSRTDIEQLGGVRCDPRPLASQSGHLTGALTCLWPDDDRRAACDPCGHRAARHDAAVRPPPEHHRLGNDRTSPTPAAAWMCGGGGGLLYRNGRMGAGDDFALRVFPRTPSICYERRSELATVFRGSSAVEHPTVNRMVVGSNPTRGAKSVTLEIALDMPRLYRRWPRYQAGLVIRLASFPECAVTAWRYFRNRRGAARRALMAGWPQWPLIRMIGRSSRLLARSWAD